jgi:hypothetical protein
LSGGEERGRKNGKISSIRFDGSKLLARMKSSASSAHKSNYASTHLPAKINTPFMFSTYVKKLIKRNAF